jgi:phospholipase/lecithinase/hemolysin
VDVNEIFTQIVERPVRFGFSNSSGAAFNPATGVEQPNPDSYVFWDGFHPTQSVAHEDARPPAKAQADSA